jgi:hypothetical protein
MSPLGRLRGMASKGYVGFVASFNKESTVRVAEDDDPAVDVINQAHIPVAKALVKKILYA